MQRSNLFTSDDTFFGVCQAIGDDFGFNPNYLRIAFAAPLIWAPAAVIGAYLALGIIVLAARIAFPSPRPAARPAVARAADAPVGCDNDAEVEALAA